ncbi:hypothetical protein D3C86_1178660 [compost metagenome]
MGQAPLRWHRRAWGIHQGLYPDRLCLAGCPAGDGPGLVWPENRRLDCRSARTLWPVYRPAGSYGHGCRRHDHSRHGGGRRLYRGASPWDGDQGVAGRRHCRVDIPDHPSGHRPQGVDAGRAGAARIPGAACADPGSAQWPAGGALGSARDRDHQRERHGQGRGRGQGPLRRGHRQLATRGRRRQGDRYRGQADPRLHG